MRVRASGSKASERSRRSLAALVALLATVAGACRTTTSTLPPSPSRLAATHSVATAAWELRDGSDVVGRVLRMDTVEAAPRTVFVVQNPEGQDLGLIDALGRAWRYRAHEREPDWIATGTVVQGARAILGASESAELVEVDAPRRARDDA